VARYDTDGNLDRGFNDKGIASLDFSAGANAIAIQDDGRIVVAGSTVQNGKSDFALARYTSAGTLDPTFGTNGRATFDGDGFGDVAYAAALQGDGKLVIAGQSGRGADTSTDFALLRLACAEPPVPVP